MSKKYIIMNDVHFGVRNGSQAFMVYQSKVYNSIIKYAVKNSITHLVILGDVFDKRKTIDFSVYQFALDIFKRFADNGINIIISLGNHDVYYKDTNKLNSPEMLLGHLPNVKVLTECGVLDDTHNIGIMPWITQDNSEECQTFIKDNKFDALLGHFEISGFVMHKGGITLNHGLKQGLFSHHKNVYSGHYHYKSNIGNIQYLGSQFQFTWSDADDTKFFHVLDSNTGFIQTIAIEEQMYTVLNEIPKSPDDYKDMFVRIMLD